MNLDFWNTIDRIGIVTGLIVSIPVFWSWWMLFSEKNERKKILAELEKLQVTSQWPY